MKYRLSDRVLTTPDGRGYVWKSSLWNDTFKGGHGLSFLLGNVCYDTQLYQQLVPVGSKVPVVETHNATWGLFKPHRRGGMRIHTELKPFLEVVLLSFIVCLRERRTESPCD